MNIILKSFGGELHSIIATEAFRGKHIGTCIHISDNDDCKPQIDADRFTWMPAGQLRAGKYDVDWTAFTPLDEQLIENMRRCEAVFLSQVGRYGIHGDIPYEERKRQYMAHLRYWNHVLEKEEIGLFLLFVAPHQGYDYVIYELCKHKGIPSYHLEIFPGPNSITITKYFERAGEAVMPTFEKLKQEYADPNVDIPLSAPYEKFYTEQITEDVSAFETPLRAKHYTKQNFFAKWWRIALNMLFKKPKVFLRSLCSPAVWVRRIAAHKTTKFYDEHTQKPDLSVPYVYLPLHMQPEEAVNPRGGAFENQELVIQMLAACLPPDIHIYIKEHPAQEELCRSREFYQALLDIPNVQFVPRGTSTFTLIRHAKAVATLTGTVGIEALFREIPVLMFGHRFYQYIPGVHRIRTLEDCKKAIKSIFKKEEKPVARDMRIFLKAMEFHCTPHIVKPITPEQIVQQKNYLPLTGAMVRKTIEPLFL